MSHLQASAICLLSISAAPVAKEDPKADLANVQGTWEIVAMEAEGKKLPKEDYRDGKWMFKGDTIIAIRKGQERELASFALDSTKRPKWIDTTSKEDKTHLLGIYELTGDELKICISKKPLERPTEFSTKADRQHGLITLKRVKN